MCPIFALSVFFTSYSVIMWVVQRCIHLDCFMGCYWVNMGKKWFVINAMLIGCIEIPYIL